MRKKKKLKKLFSDEDASYILNNYLTEDYAQIADSLGVKRHNVVYFLKREGLEGNKKKLALSEDELEYVKDNYYKITKYDIAKKFNINVSTAGYYIKQLGLNGSKRKPNHPYCLTKDQESFILKNYLHMTNDDLAIKLGCRKSHVIRCIKDNGLMGYRLWSDKNISFLEENYTKMTDIEMAEKTGRTESAIYSKRIELNLMKKEDLIFSDIISVEKSNEPLKRKKRTVKMWTEDEESFVKQNYNFMSDLEMANHLQRTKKGVKHKRLSFNLFRETCVSNQELEISRFLEKHNKSFETQFPVGRYLFDFKINNNLIEFNGDYYHCNPKVYKNGPINQYQQYIIIKDSEKIKTAEDLGYNVIVIWENDYEKDKINILNKLLAVS